MTASDVREREGGGPTIEGVRTVALVLTLALLVLTGCTWSSNEPGLLRGGETEELTSPSPPAPTDPALPVAGETTWTTAEGQQVSTRIAVHALRRAPGMTVLDWSITPLSAPDRRPGEEVPPGFDLGLDRSTAGGISMVLLDTRTEKVYRPFSHQSRSQAYGCLCTPIWAVQPTLHIGETRLLQVAFPPLPASVRFVDVVPATLPPFSHVPVSARGWLSTATHPADLALLAEPIAPLTAPQYFQTDDGADTRRRATLRVDEVLVGNGSTTVRWTLRSMSGQRAFLVVPLGLPLVAPAASDLPMITTNAASGPTLTTPHRRPLAARWMTGDFTGRPFLECLCTNLDIWAIGLRTAGGSAQLVTTYPALPRGTDRVDIVLPGVANLTALPVSPSPDGATRVGPPTPVQATAPWTYDPKRPPLGWRTDEWPTPLPDSAQLRDYHRRVDRLTTLGR